MEDYNIYCGDCLNYIKKIPSESIDLIVTDPPYLINYQSSRRIKKEKFEKIKNDVNSQQLICDYFEECNRILKNNTAIYCFCSWHHIDFFLNKNLKNILN